jgi:hypothetical protein
VNLDAGATSEVVAGVRAIADVLRESLRGAPFDDYVVRASSSASSSEAARSPRR